MFYIYCRVLDEQRLYDVCFIYLYRNHCVIFLCFVNVSYGAAVILIYITIVRYI